MPDTCALRPEALAAACARIDSLARDIGRLRRLADGLADCVLELDAMLAPSAADLTLVAGLDRRGVAAALSAVDDRVRELHRLVACPGCVECRR